MSSPENQKRKKNPTSILSLPEELLLTCIARVSRLYYPTLSLVSKRFRSLLASPELYNARSSRRESCLYMCITYSSDDHRWFTLYRKPLTNEMTNKNKRSGGYYFGAVPISQSPHLVNQSLAAVGSSIYSIGGGEDGQAPSSRVSILDCQSHTWREGPSLPVEITTYSTSVIDQTIYVAGQCRDIETSIKMNVVKVYDTRTQIWDQLDSVGAPVDGYFRLLAYDHEEGKWDYMFGRTMSQSGYCVVNNVLYSARDGYLLWYDTKVRLWRKLKGLVGLPWFHLLPRYENSGHPFVRLADYGGKLVILWEMRLPYSFIYNRKLCCAEITLEKLKNGEIWGNVEWVDHVLTVPSGFSCVKLLAASV